MDQGFVMSEERPPFDPSRGGELGVTPILWRLRMQYEWIDYLEEQHPDWDQCCTCWIFAISEKEARAKVWTRFEPPAVMPVSIASCVPERYENERDKELERRWATPTPGKDL
jgi:hypothetical protein